MERRLDYYLERLVSEEQQTFHRAIHDFVDEAIAPRWLEWERGHQLMSGKAARTGRLWRSNGRWPGCR